MPRRDPDRTRRGARPAPCGDGRPAAPAAVYSAASTFGSLKVTLSVAVTTSSTLTW